MEFSVVIPARNAEQWIGRALQSVNDQHCQPQEIIVIDDGSTDLTKEVVRKSGVEVTLLESNHRNGAGTRNVGIQHASSDWIAFLDADDYWYPNHLQRAAELLTGTQDVGFLNWFDSISIESPTPKSYPVTLDIQAPTSGLDAKCFYQNFAKTRWFNMPGCVVNRHRLIEVGMLDNTQIRRHDIDMWIRLIHKRTWCFDPIASSVYRKDTPGSISKNVADSSYFALRAFVKNRDRLPEPVGTELIQSLAWSAGAGSLIQNEVPNLKRTLAMAIPELNGAKRTVLTIGSSVPGLASVMASLVQIARRQWRGSK